MATTLWIDASVGVAGDMLAGALVDCGVPLEVMRSAIDRVVPGMVAISTERVQRAGFAATAFEVTVNEAEAPHRHLSTIRELVESSGLDPAVKESVLRVFTRLAQAEAAAHGTSVDDVHFHEVGAADSIADIVAVCAGIAWLGVTHLSFSTLELGHGATHGAHGRIPVPTPAALHLTESCTITSAFEGEMATPTGLALLTALGTQSVSPALRIQRTGAGAGTRDPEDHANIVRVLLGDVAQTQWLLEANVDDMDPRLWPGAIDSILHAGARDAWLTPIVMKKGRPALTLSVLCTEAERAAVEEAILRSTTTIGMRVVEVEKVALDRGFTAVDLEGQPITVKFAGRHGRIYNVSVEWDDVAKAAATLGRAERTVLESAEAAAAAHGLSVGGEFPTT